MPLLPVPPDSRVWNADPTRGLGSAALEMPEVRADLDGRQSGKARRLRAGREMEGDMSQVICDNPTCMVRAECQHGEPHEPNDVCTLDCRSYPGVIACRPALTEGMPDIVGHMVPAASAYRPRLLCPLHGPGRPECDEARCAWWNIPPGECTIMSLARAIVQRTP